MEGITYGVLPEPSFKMDEGYVEDTRSLFTVEPKTETPPARALPEWVLGMGERDRTNFVCDVMRSLTTSSVVRVLEQMQPRLHVDPTQYLPAELTYQVFSYLDHREILKASQVSRAWRSASLNTAIWRNLYQNIGWEADRALVKTYEDQLSRKGKDTSSWQPQTGAIEADEMDMEVPLQIVPSLSSFAKVNWQFLFKQRRRLEDNWNRGRYKLFQIPSPEHMEEAHTECIYTIQYSGKYVLSGSRDKTLRIWDTNTRRLVREPLVGHEGSVLCAQFDPEEDVVISGSSDTNVIVWKFSTGEIQHKIERAHEESVLNLRFDRRYLVTCSKDKLIKVWSRTVIESGPDYVIETGPQPEYVLLRVLTGHCAAVNAIQMHSDEIASASGDRSVKIWSIGSGRCLRTLSGHSKGIACVQYDGRRVVTGSSDNSIRIFDRESGTEVAMLQGHHALVRTVQANFGDRPGSSEQDELEARLSDEKMTRDFSQRMDAGFRSRHAEGPGTFGASLPPGGGGTVLGRIVSGSYDESIIIWKRDPLTKKWIVNHKLGQDEALKQTWRYAKPALRHGAHSTAPLPTAGPSAPVAPFDAVPVPFAELPTTQAAIESPRRRRAQVPAGFPPLARPNFMPPSSGQARVFKLHFDFRQIVCCSQDNRLVGWDFADGDPDILEACQFFRGN